jgi:hypothetical protein
MEFARGSRFGSRLPDISVCFVLLVWLLPKIVDSYRLPRAFGFVRIFFVSGSVNCLDYFFVSKTTSSLDDSDAGGAFRSMGP